jgi:flagellar motility protein MotE (MotC chaperone)
MERKLIESQTWVGMLEPVIWEARDALTSHRDMVDQLKKENDALKQENKVLKETIEELTAGKEEEDPQERIMYNSKNEVVPIAEGMKKKASKDMYP